MSGIEETVEMTVKVPKNVVEAVRERVLKLTEENEQSYWEKAIIQTVISDIDFHYSDPKSILEKHGMLRYYKG